MATPTTEDSSMPLAEQSDAAFGGAVPMQRKLSHSGGGWGRRLFHGG